MKSKPPGPIKQVLLRWMGVGIEDSAALQTLYSEQTVNGRVLGQAAALNLSTVWACVRLISESIATLPIGFYRRKPDGSRVMADGHALYSILRAQPNASMAATTFWEALTASLLLWGNAYVEIQRIAGEIVGLNFLPAARVKVTRVNSLLLRYEYTEIGENAGRVREIKPENMMHVPAFSLDGIIGLSPVRYGASVLSNALATEDAAGKMFSQGMRASGFISAKEYFKQTQREQMQASLNKFRGDNDPGAIMLLEGGMDYKTLQMNPDDAQLLQSRAWGVEELCRWFRVPPFMVGHSEKSTSWGTGIEQQMIGFVTFVLRPWCVRIEQAINRSLVNSKDKGRYYAEFALEGLLRGDSASRAAFYGVMIDKGILTRDEVRALENWPAMDGNAGVLTVQSATVPLDGITNAAAPAKAADALKQWLSEA